MKYAGMISAYVRRPVSSRRRIQATALPSLVMKAVSCDARAEETQVLLLLAGQKVHPVGPVELLVDAFTKLVEAHRDRDPVRDVVRHDTVEEPVNLPLADFRGRDRLEVREMLADERPDAFLRSRRQANALGDLGARLVGGDDEVLLYRVRRRDLSEAEQLLVEDASVCDNDSGVGERLLDP